MDPALLAGTSREPSTGVAQAMNAAERLLCEGAARSIALQCGDKRISYGELREAVRKSGGAWVSLGVQPDSRVVIFARDSIDWVVAYLGVIWAGGVAIGVNPRLPAVDLAPILVDSEVRFLWCDGDDAATLCALAASLPGSPLVVANGGNEAVDWPRALAAARHVEACKRDDDDAALWIGTSGTTGIPKGVMHLHRVGAEPERFARDVLRAGPGDVFYSSSKLFFAYALANSLFAGLRLGATVILDREHVSPLRVLEMVERHHPTLVFTVPTLYNRMLQDGVAGRLAAHGIRHFVSAGEALPAGVRDGWLRATGMAPISGYGTSETLCLVLYGDDDSGLLRPTPGTALKFAAPDPKAPQRIWLSSPALAHGYWRRPEAQADGFRDGWFSPGDIFLRHDDGRLEFAGRSDDMLKVSGQWVSTLWIEHALAEACGDAIEQVAAVGTPTGDGLVAIAVLAVAAPGRDNDARARLAAGIEGLPRYRRPAWVHWLPALPQTATGKLQRSRLHDTHLDALAQKAPG
jgi:acyl-coenzyme A synthetase/AMP-(fatty) acid ligase